MTKDEEGQTNMTSPNGIDHKDLNDGLDEIDVPPTDERRSLDRREPRKREFGIIPIPKSKRHDPTLKVHEQFVFTWKMNLILAGAAVSRLDPCGVKS
jgi:hypothetical protein